MDYDRWLWGKKEPFCSLSRHMIAVGACAMEYLSAPSTSGVMALLCTWMGMDKESVLHTFSYVAAMHDIGKAHPTFQEKRDPTFRHEQYGAEEILKALWRKRGWDERQTGLLRAVVRLHHQGKGMCDTNKRIPDEYKACQVSLEVRMWQLFAPASELHPFGNCDALGALLSAILILCDWVASSEGFGAEQLPDVEDTALLMLLRERARQTLRDYGLIDESAEAYPRESRFSRLFPTIPAEHMRPIQRACEAVGERRALLTIIEAPMGEGKTEAALYLAGRLCECFGKRGIYMALPTAATSNQMVGRVRRMLAAHQSGTARLLHSMAWLIDDKSLSSSQFDTEDADSAEDWLRPLRRGMLSENAVGTVDQAMAAVLRIKYGLLRLAGLSNKVLIIDEIHAYDLYMSTIIARLLAWCRAISIPVILLSATMQDSQKRKYMKCYEIDDFKSVEAYPLITQVTEDGQCMQTPVAGVEKRGTFHFVPRALGCDAEAIAAHALQRASGGGCLCVMLNTVKQAQSVYRAIKQRGETQVMLFHARFTAIRREDIEKRCNDLFGRNGARPKRMILVCTQVVEQSLDVDFDAMITQLAPMDLLLQRAGRVHRHADNPRPAEMKVPTVEVIVPGSGATDDIERRYAQIGGVYAPGVMRCTEALLGEGRTVAVPEDVRACVEAAYRDISDQEPEEALRQMMRDMFSVTGAEGGLLMPPRPNRFFAQTPSNANSLSLTDTGEDSFVSGARTREGKRSQRFAFLPKDFPENDGSRAWLRRAMTYSVSCPVKNRGLTERRENGIIQNKGKEKYIKRLKILRETEHGLYRGEDCTFSYSDEYGAEEVSD